MTEFDDNLLRCELMVKGNVSWNINKEDQIAIQALLNERKELLTEIQRLSDKEKDPIKIPDQIKLSNDHSLEEALYLCDQILELVEELPGTDKAIEFGKSIEEKTRSIKAFIEKNEIVTKPQLQSLENMKYGVEKWIH